MNKNNNNNNNILQEDTADLKIWSKPIKEELCLSYDLKVRFNLKIRTAI